MRRFLFLLTPLWIITGCSVSAVPQHGFTVSSVSTLDAELGETSGLFCRDDMAFTINDSGNKPEVFVINRNGETTGRVEVSATNRDWETITGDAENLFIGDIGNNAGKRSALNIYRVAAERSDVEQTISISYANNRPAQNQPYAHDFDGEAMTYRDGDLIIFSKSWETGRSHVYHISPDIDKQVLTPAVSVDNLPGVVTGADWSEQYQEFVLVGYRSNAFGLFKAFIATLDANYQVKTVDLLPEFTQVEGVCYAKDGEVWITQESTPYSSAKIAVLEFR
ncbi:hypothetical protein [Aestuariibacter sp. A3R04]|uniref:hypothetical protein n=1 Tax=Aestuariibacter sp. A3R04 TaxID=2841571 RepID=UPI001C0933DE|nr:hypothetical protein [Aestuariibacter sp. A3R04]MBU3020752.1 hypothetical protein [Aestuariibacter sp. A3R04]